MPANGVIEDSTGDLLRASYGTVTPAAGAGETLRVDVPDPPKPRQVGVPGLYQNWNGAIWQEFPNPPGQADQIDLAVLIADVDDLVIPGFQLTTFVLRMEGSANNRRVTGIVPPEGVDEPSKPYFRVLLLNKGTGNLNLVFTHEDAGSQPANRFSNPREVDLTLATGSSLDLYYDPEKDRWSFVSRT